jgi:hypothetical protein
MPFFLEDVLAYGVAVALFVPLQLLPAAVLGFVLNPFGFRETPASERFAIALLLAIGVLPVFAALVWRLAGVWPAIVILAAFGVVGLVASVRAGTSGGGMSSLSVPAFVCAAFGLMLVDVDLAGQLHANLTIGDGVKHAATVRAIAEGGASALADPYFLRTQPGSYYYYFYVAPALIEAASGGVANSRMAFAAQAFWTCIALLSLLRFVWARAALDPLGRGYPVALAGALLLVGGLQMIYLAALALVHGEWLAQSNWGLGDQWTNWPMLFLWVPHHVSGLIAAWVGFAALADVRDGRAKPSPVVALIAGAAFASAAGLSVWVTIGAVVTIAVWCCDLAWRRAWVVFGLVLAAGLVSAVLSSVYLYDLVTNRPAGESPMVVGLRWVPLADLVVGALRAVATSVGITLPATVEIALTLALLPANYLIEAGLLFIGAIAYWRHRRRSSAPAFASEVGRLLAISAGVALVLGSTVRSSVLSNDFGWRVILFTQFAFVLWSAVAFRPVWERLAARGLSGVRRVPQVVAATLALGFIAPVHDVIAVRGFHAVGVSLSQGQPFDPAEFHDVRRAYAWLARAVPHSAVVQHNPDTTRAYGYGLYGLQRTAVADDHNGMIFGAGVDDVQARIWDLMPVFRLLQPASDVRARLARHGIDYVVVASEDPAWRRRAPWIFESPALFATDRVRVLRVRDITTKDERLVHAAH